jgi:hypothetical protein
MAENMQQSESLRECCRFCLKKANNFDFLMINDEIKRIFEDLTKISLSFNEKYSSNCCHVCLNNLQLYENIKNEFITNQNFLYSLEMRSDVKLEGIISIKKENLDDSNDPAIDFFPELEMKHEIFTNSNDQEEEIEDDEVDQSSSDDEEEILPKEKKVKRTKGTISKNTKDEK